MARLQISSADTYRTQFPKNIDLPVVAQGRSRRTFRTVLYMQVTCSRVYALYPRQDPWHQPHWRQPRSLFHQTPEAHRPRRYDEARSKLSSASLDIPPRHRLVSAVTTALALTLIEAPVRLRLLPRLRVPAVTHFTFLWSKEVSELHFETTPAFPSASLLRLSKIALRIEIAAAGLPTYTCPTTPSMSLHAQYPRDWKLPVSTPL